MTDPSDDDGERIRWFEAQAEAAYDRMYDAHDPTSAMVCYSDVKEFLTDAISLARKLGDEEAVSRLAARLTHIKAVYRSQFS